MRVSEKNPKVLVSKLATVVTVLLSVAVLAGIGFGFGWFLSGKQLTSLSVTDGSSPTTTAPEQGATLPESDVDGKDVVALPRYPESVRVSYSENSVGNGETLTKVGYETVARRDEVKDFYRGVFRSGEWTVEDLEFSNGEWSFLVVDDERQAYVEIEPEGKKVVRISIRLEATDREQREPNAAAEPPATTGSAGGQAEPSPGYVLPDDDYYDDYEDDYDGSEVPDDSEDD